MFRKNLKKINKFSSLFYENKFIYSSITMFCEKNKRLESKKKTNTGILIKNMQDLNKIKLITIENSQKTGNPPNYSKTSNSNNDSSTKTNNKKVDSVIMEKDSRDSKSPGNLSIDKDGKNLWKKFFLKSSRVYPNNNRSLKNLADNEFFEFFNV